MALYDVSGDALRRGSGGSDNAMVILWPRYRVRVRFSDCRINVTVISALMLMFAW